MHKEAYSFKSRESLEFVSKKQQDQSWTVIKLALYWVIGACNNVLEANLLKCVQINNGLKQANKNKKIKKQKDVDVS